MKKTINKNERVPVHVKPNEVVEFSIMNGIDYYMDTLHIKYDKKYANAILNMKYFDANGFNIVETILLEGNGVMSWMNNGQVESSNFGSISFTCRQEIIFDFNFS